MDFREEKKHFFDTNQKIIVRNIIISLILAVVAVIIIVMPKFDFNKQSENPEFSEVDRICELATLECYYHNVAEYKKQPDGLFKYGLFQYGYKKIWIEYDSVVKVGINADEVEIDPPDNKNQVKVHVPEAKVLDDGEIVINSIRDPITDTGVLTKVTSEDKQKTLDKAQKDMLAEAEADENILRQAHENAKELLEQYIKKVGKLTRGEEFEVVWVNE